MQILSLLNSYVIPAVADLREAGGMPTRCLANRPSGLLHDNQSQTLFHNVLQCFSLFYSYMLHNHQLYLLCNPSRLVLLYFFTRETTVLHLNQVAEL